MDDSNAARAGQASELQRFLEADPNAAQHALDIVAQRLSHPPDDKTWDVLFTGLANYLGEGARKLLEWASTPEQGAAKFAELEQHASPAVVSFVRRLIGRHGLELQNAYACWQELPNDWRFTHREVYFDEITKRHHLSFRIDKFNGESALIEGSADSMMGLARHLLRTLRWVGTRDAFGEDAVSEFLLEARELISLLLPDEEDQEDSADEP